MQSFTFEVLFEDIVTPEANLLTSSGQIQDSTRLGTDFSSRVRLVSTAISKLLDINEFDFADNRHATDKTCGLGIVLPGDCAARTSLR